ncbi:MAG TPA: hypothetical protein VLH79_14330 [Chthonomonadales bacterium]|nr:hypothetical protein [Chthonomonadales bacterium]
MRRMVFRDIDVLHYTDPACPAISVQPAVGMAMDDVLFENVRIRHEGQAFFVELNPHPTPWAKKQTPGRIRNIVFRNVSLEGPPESHPGREGDGRRVGVGRARGGAGVAWG